jgi:hypothetical protein
LQADIVKGVAAIDVDEIMRTANASARLLASLRKRQRAPAAPMPSLSELERGRREER